MHRFLDRRGTAHENMLPHVGDAIESYRRNQRTWGPGTTFYELYTRANQWQEHDANTRHDHKTWRPVHEDQIQVDTLIFTEITNTSLLHATAEAMKNFLRAYGEDCMAGECVVLRIDQDNRLRGALELRYIDDHWILRQLIGVRRRGTTTTIKTAADTVRSLYNEKHAHHQVRLETLAV